ncbi:MAG: hydroxymethylglutaryl-CoA synthase [Candidatus Roizmanbacteria bacterium]
MTGIVDYGFYIPRYRIKVDEIASYWQRDGEEIKKSLSVEEKAVASHDEDVVTMAIEASAIVIQNLKHKEKIGAIFVGTETSPYAVKPISTMIGEWLDIPHHYLAYDTQFACKATTGALISANAMVKSKKVVNVLVCGADKANAKPQDILECTSGSGAVALLIGDTNVAVEIVDSTSFSSDTPDFWRRSMVSNPTHAGRFTGKPAYFHHITSSTNYILEKNKLRPEDFTYAVFHMPNGKFPIEVSRILGFSQQQIQKGLVVKKLGNSYTACALMGLVSVLEEAKEDDTIFLASYGSGAGSDAFILKVTKHIDSIRKNFKEKLDDVIYISYRQYQQFMGGGY